MTPAMQNADPELVRTWLIGWTITRGTPAPVKVGDGLRVDVGWPEQRARFVFPELSTSVATLAARIREPWFFIKVCAQTEALAKVVRPPWELHEQRFFMSLHAEMSAQPLADGYQLETLEEGAVRVAQVRDLEGSVVARGGLVCVNGYAIYDRIETSVLHRRRGLASAVMTSLGALARRSGVSRGLLVATAAGRPLYEKLGWTVDAPYATAVIPGASGRQGPP